MNNKLSSYNETRGIYQKNVNSRKRIKSFLTLSNNVDLLVISYWRSKLVCGLILKTTQQTTIITSSIINSYSYEQTNTRFIRRRDDPLVQTITKTRLRSLYNSTNSESKILYNDGRRHSWGYNKTNCMYVPVEEEQNQTEAEQRIEKLV